MTKELTWMVGGQQGDGFSSCGETFALGLNRLGYHIYGYFTNSSRILGGHANYRVRISSSSRLANADALDILVAFDEETITLNAPKLREGGLILCDESIQASLPSDQRIHLVKVPMIQIASEAGSKIYKTMVAVGASAALVGVEPSIFAELMEQRFKHKGDQVVAKNVTAIQQGFDYVKEHFANLSTHQLDPVKKVKRMLMTGNEAVALGATAAGCRVMPAYPITPATDIMEYLIKRLPKIGGIVLQTEDEIAAINMAIGAAYAGARAMTATSGPGLSLMMEAIGLSGMTETPIVIVDTQRGGPSTGLPTKHEQSDLNACLYGTHGEIPKIVLAPSTAENCFYDTMRAFNLAEMYQCPVIVMTDLALSQANQTVEILDSERETIERGKFITEPEAVNPTTPFKRYELTPDGISPRIIPGVKGGIHHVTGVEHSEIGRPKEGTLNRQEMMDKRFRKLEDVEIANSIDFHGYDESDILLIGFGSSCGAIDEAIERLSDAQQAISHAHVKVLMPFPSDPLKPYIEKAKRVLVVENNGTGQLAALIRQQLGYAEKIESLLKYNGEPFYPNEIEQRLKEMIACQRSKISVTK